MTTNKKIRACAYARVSTEKKEQATSLENQKEYYEKLIQDKGYEFIGIYSDSLTGTNANRPGFQQLLYDAGIDKVMVEIPNGVKKFKKEAVYHISPTRKPLFDEIWIKNTSRYFRNTILSSTIINLLTSINVHIFFESQNLNTRDVNSEVFIKLMAIFDEEESKDKSQKVKWGIERGKEKGIISSSSKLYGYKYSVEENKLTIIPEEAEVVRLIFELFSQELGARRISNELNIRGIKTRNGAEFGKTTIQRIIKNEKYAGLNNRCKYDMGLVFNKNSYAQVRDNYEVNKTEKIEPIISEELFYSCQKIANSKINTINSKGLFKGVSEYAGLLYCGKCEEVYTSNMDRGRQFYNCKTKKLNGTSFCDNPNISKKYIDEALNDLANGGYYEDIICDRDVDISRLNGLKCHLIDTLDVDLSTLVQKQKEELGQLIEENRKYASMFAKGQIDELFFNEQHNEIKKQIDILEIDISNNSKSNKEIINDISIIDQSIQQLLDLEVKYLYTKEEILNEIERIIVKLDEKDEEIILIFEYKAISLINSITEKYQELFSKVSDFYDPELFKIKEKRLKDIKTSFYAI